ncbi:antifreeze protein Maxi-like isoform X1 [Nannospalax galili]|uniref:antifreeze protein Maxi-like isoform X1 n=1 Tax=Nannospalax galili TaxID=1026970 RepID=UPI000819F5FD|nr:antifreeze protein Maxi-like isoform X1 [Nannospalax galili]XP_017651736.1 antifreeze protein Maxi-like isoform X1 [Nannospalax galili]
MISIKRERNDLEPSEDRAQKEELWCIQGDEKEAENWTAAPSLTRCTALPTATATGATATGTAAAAAVAADHRAAASTAATTAATAAGPVASAGGAAVAAATATTAATATAATAATTTHGVSREESGEVRRETRERRGGVMSFVSGGPYI